MLPYHFDQLFGRFENLIVREAKDRPAERFERLLPLAVTHHHVLELVDAAIDLNNQS